MGIASENGGERLGVGHDTGCVTACLRCGIARQQYFIADNGLGGRAGGQGEADNEGEAFKCAGRQAFVCVEYLCI
ncbi:MAG: hypothetical protein CME89_09755 [Hirschia sp.]|nr:hypothetical protein [Hirschia sp.]